MRPLKFCASFVVATAAIAFLVAIPHAVAQSYPQRPVRMIVPFPPGGSTDIVARVIAQNLSERLGRQVVVDNRGGAGGIIGMNLAAKATPDGYTLLMDTGITHAAGASLYSNLPYNVLTDFAAITEVASVPLLVVINPAVSAKSIEELIDLAKAKPGQLNYSSPGSGTSGHLAAELLKTMAGANIVHVPYKGGGPAVAALVAGEVQLTIISAVAALPHVKSGRLRALAITSLARVPSLPDIPTVAESGVPDYEVELWYGMFAPAKTPRNLLGRLNRELVKIVQGQQFRDRLTSEGGRAVGNSEREFEERVKADVEKWAKVVKDAGIKID